MKSNRDSDLEEGGFIRNPNGGNRNRGNGNKPGFRYEKPFNKTPEVSPFHRAKDMIMRAGLSSGSEGDLVAFITAAGTTEILRLLDSGELQEQIKQARV